MNSTPMKLLLAVALCGAVHTGAGVNELREGSKAAQISFDVTDNWGGPE
jgi:hypothetical protein